jgi:hypothetical protein
MRRHVSSNTRAAAQGQEPRNDGRFSIKDAVLIVDTEEDAHAAREHLGMEAFVYDRLAEQLPSGGLSGPVFVVSKGVNNGTYIFARGFHAGWKIRAGLGGLPANPQ